MKVRSRSRLARVGGWWVWVLVATAGCGPALPEELEAEPVTREDEIRIPNSLTTQALVFNALSTNRAANQRLGTRSLHSLFTAPGDSYIQNQLRDPWAQTFMSYLVSCALKTGQDIAWTHPLTNQPEVWHGKLGICSEWATQAPSRSCQEQVSACLLARNNAFGQRVELSMRGEHPNTSVFRLEQVTRPTEYDPDTSQRVASFSECATQTLGVSRSCGWTVDAIGSCQPGATVRLGAGGRAPDTCTGPVMGSSSGTRMMLRVCEGIAGCNDSGARFLAQSEGSCLTTPPAVAFTCPSAGYFNVMTAPYDSTLQGTASVATEPSGRIPYRLSEAEVFRMREGAYYGTIFDPDALAAEITVIEGEIIGRDQVVRGSVYRRMFSCNDVAWTSGAAGATHRVCALPSSGANCAAEVTGTCVDPASPSFPDSMCATDDGSQIWGDGDYQSCRDRSGRLWKAPVTVYLNGACDVVGGYGDPTLCKR
ncbi:hypothetical protein [Hyalangium sp.]|uniref:hypothetical protein n=1 Tax=Hyalangium sp. TaxID=2028555 RepID=UPI002D5DDFB3|nr:hypothetical protein [Hyalangium sp.]HYH95848.1 hypothetical protein [Hyalangium sp.]